MPSLPISLLLSVPVGPELRTERFVYIAIVALAVPGRFCPGHVSPKMQKGQEEAVFLGFIVYLLVGTLGMHHSATTLVPMGLPGPTSVNNCISVRQRGNRARYLVCRPGKVIQVNRAFMTADSFIRVPYRHYLQCVPTANPWPSRRVSERD